MISVSQRRPRAIEATNSARFSDRIGRHETVRRWVNHFGSAIATDLRKRRPKPHSTWHLDEVYIKVDGRLVYLWRAVHAEGEVLDVLVQSKRESAQRSLSFHAATYNTFNVQRHLTSASTHRVFRASAMRTWREVTVAA